jgi:nitrite reductase/ring-hydroxylating ferredoxin subunit
MSKPVQWVEACAVDDIAVGEVLGVRLAGESVALYRVEDSLFYATTDICSHGYAHLSQGYFEDCVIECPLHGGQFDIRSGKGLCDPIEVDIATYPVRTENGQVLIGLEASVETCAVAGGAKSQPGPD